MIHKTQHYRYSECKLLVINEAKRRVGNTGMIPVESTKGTDIFIIIVINFD